MPASPDKSPRVSQKRDIDREASRENPPSKAVKAGEPGATGSTPSPELREKLQKCAGLVLELKSAEPAEEEGPMCWEECLPEIQQHVEAFGKAYQKAVKEGGGQGVAAEWRKVFAEEFLEKAVIPMDKYFKLEAPEKLPMYLTHRISIRDGFIKNLVPHQGGLMDVVFAIVEFSHHLVKSTPGVPMDLYMPLLGHLERYYNGLRNAGDLPGQEGGADLRVAGGEIGNLRKYICSCNCCKEIARFYAVQHEETTLVLRDLTPGEITHIYQTKLDDKDGNVELTDLVVPKKSATASKQKKITFRKIQLVSEDPGVAIMRYYLHKWQKEAAESQT